MHCIIDSKCIFIEDHCPTGWYETRSECMMVVEADTNLDYDDAKAKCEEVDPIAYPAVPYNEYLQDHLKNIIENSSLTEDAFWIGCRNSNFGDLIIN